MYTFIRNNNNKKIKIEKEVPFHSTATEEIRFCFIELAQRICFDEVLN